MKIVSWNVNGFRAILKKNFNQFISDYQPDILCLQEIKADIDKIPAEWQNHADYYSFFQPAKKSGYSGVAILCKLKPINVHLLNIAQFDDEGRVLIAEFEKFTLINCYFPNSQAERKRLSYKQSFNKAVQKLCHVLVSESKNVIICGDYNVAHQPIDLANPKDNENNAGYYLEERQDMTNFLGFGFIDTFRYFCPEPHQYTWWSYRSMAREKNIGWRIDYFCVNQDFIRQVKSSIILKSVLGSDHCPVELVL